MKPADIETLSFEIIDKEAGEHGFPEDKWSIVRRMIHTSADYEYLDSVRFTEGAVKIGIEAIRSGKNIVTDTNMAKAGIRKKEVGDYGGSVHCLITDPSVTEIAKKEGSTRAKAAVDSAVPLMEGGIYVVGNAPTALLRLMELIREGAAKPALILGFPVGFVNAAESKAELCETDFPHISNFGRKGGSNIAAAVVNALIILAGKE